jgi:peroxiredoxin
MWLQLIFPKTPVCDYYCPPVIHGGTMRIYSLIAFGVMAAPLCAGSPDIRLDSVNYADLITELKSLKGKVVLVDVWGTFCNPCKEKFPKVVSMHDTYARRGLSVVSVSVDPPDDKDAAAAARQFLTRQRATFRNVQLTDKADVWQEKWQVVGPPLLFLFDREGRLVARWQDKVDMDVVEKRVVELLKDN